MSAVKENLRDEAALDDETILVGIFVEFGDDVPASAVVPRLREEHFSSPELRALWWAVYECRRLGRTPDPATIRRALVARPKPVTPETVALLNSMIVDPPPTATNVDHYATSILKRFSERRLNEVVAKLSRQIPDGLSPEQVKSEIDQAIADGVVLPVTEFVTIDKALADYLKILERRFSAKSPYQGLSTGYTKLDDVLGGINAGHLIVLAAGTGMGKTAFAMNLVSRLLANNDSSCVAVVSCEMLIPELVERLVSTVTQIDLGRLRGGALTEADFAKIVAAQSRLAYGSRLRLTDEIFSLDRLLDRARQLVGEGVTTLVVDYLQLISGDKSHGREREVASVSGALKRLAMQTGMAVVLLSQLNREYLKRNDGRPKLSDLRESGAIEQDANSVIFVHRPGHLEDEKDDAPRGWQEAEIIIGKNRGGKKGTISFDWYGPTCTFEEHTVEI